MKKLLALVAVVALSLTACGSGGSKVVKNDYTYVYGTDISMLDYLRTSRATNHQHNANFVDGLLEHDKYGVLQPSLAKEWSHNDDFTVWTFKLRDGINWVTNTGEVYDKVVAQDFVSGLQHALEFKSGTSWITYNVIQNAMEYAQGAVTDFTQVGIKAEDDKTLVYTLAKPIPFFDTMLTYAIFYPVNKEFLESKGAGCALGTPAPDTCTFGTTEPDSILYNGAYLLTNNTAKSVIEYKANPNYWDKDKVYIPNVKLVYYDGSDPASLFNNFDQGIYSNAPVYEDNPASFELAKQKYGDSLFTSRLGSSTYYFAFNLDRNIYASPADPAAAVSTKDDKAKADTKLAILNKNFRKAVFHAVDRPALMAQLSTESLKLNSIRNAYTNPGLVLNSQGVDYSKLVEAEMIKLNPTDFPSDWKIDDSQDGYLNVNLAKEYAAKAKTELEALGVVFPIQLDVLQDQADAKGVNGLNSVKQSLESNLGSDFVQVNAVLTDEDNALAGGYYAEGGSQSNWDLSFGVGWGPDFGDPKSFLATFLPETGDVITSIGLDYPGEAAVGDDKANATAVGLYEYLAKYDKADAEYKDMDVRYQLFAEAEAFLLDQAIVMPYQANGGRYNVSKVVPYTAPYSDYGIDDNKLKGVQVSDKVITLEERNKLKATWEKERSEASKK